MNATLGASPDSLVGGVHGVVAVEDAEGVVVLDLPPSPVAEVVLLDDAELGARSLRGVEVDEEVEGPSLGLGEVHVNVLRRDGRGIFVGTNGGERNKYENLSKSRLEQRSG